MRINDALKKIVWEILRKMTDYEYLGVEEEI